MYEFVRGPMLWISVAVFVAGLVYRLIVLVRITARREPYPAFSDTAAPGLLNRLFRPLRVSARGTVWQTDRLVGAVSLVFHLCLIVTPLFLIGHSVLFFESFGLSLFSFDEATSDRMTVLFFFAALFLLSRRLFSPRVRAITTPYDYLLLLVTTAPFATGYLAYHQLFNYNTVMLCHMILGELMLIAVGATKLGHMVFFFFARFLVGGEYAILAGSRRWRT